MIQDIQSKILRLLRAKHFAYNQVFNKDSQFAKLVLKDLARFCRAHESTFHADPRRHALLEGRREVILRIGEYLQLSPDELFELHKVKEMGKKE